MTEPLLILENYQDVRNQIADGDLLLLRRRGLISIAGRGRHSHAAKAGTPVEAGDLFCLEVRELNGGRAVTLSSQVLRYAGRIDVYETHPDNRWPHYDRRASLAVMRRLAGCDDGYFNLLRAALLHLPVARLAAPLTVDDEVLDAHPPFCSQACAAADRLGGKVDPVRNLPDRLTEPSDLAGSPFYRYRFTLLP